MTPTQLEAAARELCRIRGIDPDAVEEAKLWVYLSPHSRSNWRVCACEIERFAEVGTAIASVMTLPTPRKRLAKKK